MPYWGMSRRLYLQELCNKYGDFKVAKAYKVEDGSLRWTKHRSVMECWHSEDGLRFLDNINNRQGLTDEVRLDLDPDKDMCKEDIDKWFNEVCDFLDSINFKYTGWFTGSRSYHIHFFISGYSLHKRSYDKHLYQLFRKFNAETTKLSIASMLTLEWSPNNKTGKLKSPVRGDFTCPIR